MNVIEILVSRSTSFPSFLHPSYTPRGFEDHQRCNRRHHQPPVFGTLGRRGLVTVVVLATVSWEEERQQTLLAASEASMPRDARRAEGRQTEFMPWFQLRKLLIEGPKTEPMTPQRHRARPLDSRRFAGPRQTKM